MIDILSASGEVLFSVPILADAVSHEELMGPDFVRLSWASNKGDVLPAGTYIVYAGEEYSLLEPYTPEMANEQEYRYRPEFHSRVDAWDKHPACVYSYDGGDVSSKEFDWTFVGSPADAMFIIAQAILEETGEEWTVEISDSLPATIELTCQADSIRSILSSIAEQCSTDYWVDKTSNILYLSNCSHGESIPLEVGKEVGVPSITSSSEGYYTRYYAFGSTRNISQDSSEGTYVANKRLPLNPAVYPYGYKDVRGHFENGVFVSDLLPNEVFSKVVIFDDIYPSSSLFISNVRARLKYRVKDGGEKIVVGGTAESPIYDQYAIWYFKIEGFSFSEDSIIKGQQLSVHFNDGRLAGRDFKLAYHDKEETVAKEGDVAQFKIEKGDYEILFVEEGGMILPDLAYIIPSDGDSVTLYNIEMPSEYTESAMSDLEAAVDKEMSDAAADQNTYEFSSNPVAFKNQGISLSIGQNISLISGDKTTESRVTMLERHLDFDVEQKIRIGYNVAKSTTTQLKEGLTSINYNLDVIEAFNKFSESIYESHVRTQAQINEALLKLSDMFYWHDAAKTVIGTKYDFFSQGTVASGGIGEEGSEGGGGGGDVIVDTEMSDESSNPVENKVIKAYVDLHPQYEIIEEVDSPSYTDGTIVLDDVVSDTSENGVKNKVIKAYVDGAIEPLDERITELEQSGGGAGTVIAVDVNGETHTAVEGVVTLDDYPTKAEHDTAIAALQAKDTEIDASIQEHEERISTLEEKDDMFEWVTDADGTRRIKTAYDFYSEKTVASGGIGEACEGGGGTGTVMAVEVNGTIYDSVDGIVTLPDYPTMDEYDAKMSALDAMDMSFTTDIESLKQADVTINETLETQDARILSLEDMFEWDDEEHTTIKAKHDFYSVGTVASGGVGAEGSGGSSDVIVDTEMLDESANPVENRVIKAYVDGSVAPLNERITELEHSGGSGDATVDTEMSDESSNPVENRVVKGYVDTSLEGYLPVDGEATSAAKLSDDTAYTAWGRTFFEDGKPVNVTSSPILARNGGLYAYDYKDEGTMLMWYLSDSTKSEFILGHQSSKNLERTRVCGYPISFHIGNYRNASDIPLIPAMLIDEEGDVTIEGNLIVKGTVSSGGVAQPTESELSALEARIAALEEIINGQSL